jgi:hypothetical protein
MPSAAGYRYDRNMGRSAIARFVVLGAFALLAGFVRPARADVYKCSGDDATPIYQEMPCAKGKELRNFQTDPPDITVLPSSSSAGAQPPPAKGAKEAKAPSPPKAKPAAAEVRDDAQRKFLHSGMTEAEVRSLLGSPDVTSGNNGRKTKRWQYMPTPTDPDTITALTFENGVVTSVERRIVRK